jgi:hypothetical protein
MSEPTVGRVRRVFSDLETVTGRLLEIDESEQDIADSGSQERLADAALEEKRLAITHGVRGLEKIRQGRESELTEAEELGIEAVVLEEGRPSIPVHDGDFLPPPPEWGALYTHRKEIRSSLGRVGRVEVDRDGGRSWLGTGFLAGPQIIMTSRGVALDFSRRDGRSWKFRARMSSWLDFREVPDAGPPAGYAVTEIIGIHEDHDLALLRIEATSLSGDPLPEPFVLAKEEPSDLRDREAYQIGYPARDSRDADERMHAIFHDVFDVKRLRPGRITGLTAGGVRMSHDCSSLGDCSGAPVIDLESHRVLGLHVAGRLREHGHAVPLWLLTEDPLIESAKINYA